MATKDLYNGGSKFYPTIDLEAIPKGGNKTDDIIFGASAYPCVHLLGNTLSIRGDVLFSYNVGQATQYFKFSSSGVTVKYTINQSSALVLDTTKIDSTKIGTSNPIIVDQTTGLVSVVNISSINDNHIVLAYNAYNGTGKIFGALERVFVQSEIFVQKLVGSIKAKFNVYFDEDGNVKLPSLFISSVLKNIDHSSGTATLGVTNYLDLALKTQEGSSFINLDLYKILFDGNTTLNDVVSLGGVSNDVYTIPLLVRGKTNKDDGQPIISGLLSEYLVYKPTLSVFDNYPNQLNELGFLTKKGYKSAKNNLSFGWISDGHGDKLFDADKAVDNSSAEFLVYTGDIVTQSFQDATPTLEAQALAMTKPCFLQIGNHDHWKATSLQALYDRFVAPLATKNGLTNGKLYYSKTFSDKNVKCIFLNDYDFAPSTTNYMYCTYSQEQISWLIGELKDAATNGYHVAIFRHLPAFNGVIESELWTERHFKGSISFGNDEVRTPDTNGVSSYNPIPYIIKAWKESGTYTTTYNGFSINADFSTYANGNFVAYFTGHTHGDSVHKSLGQIGIGITQPNTYQERTDLWKNSKCWHEINFVQIDTNNREIHIMRLGQRNTYDGRIRNFLCVKY